MINTSVETCVTRGIHRDIIRSVQQKLPDQVALYELADLFKLFGDSTRISILWALSDSQLVLKTIKWNIFFAIAVNLVAVTFASVGHINMLTGAILHQASALVVILNSMTLFIRKR